MNAKLLNYAFRALHRRWKHRLLTWMVFLILSTLLLSVLTIAHSLSHEQFAVLDELPQLIVQRMEAGRQVSLPGDWVYEVAAIRGVADATSRVWGYHYVDNLQTNLVVRGIDLDMPPIQASLKRLVHSAQALPDSLWEDFYFAGEVLSQRFQQVGFEKSLALYSPLGNRLELFPAGTFLHETDRITHDVLLISEMNARSLFDLPEHLATDMVVSIPNPDEVETIKRKVQMLYPDTRIISNMDLRASYQSIFNYKSGVFLALFITALVSFFNIIIERGSGLAREERQEIGIQKAVGWRTADVLSVKLIESIYIAMTAYFASVFLCYISVFYLHAPVLKHIFLGNSVLQPAFELVPIINLGALGLVFALMVPAFVLSSVFPAWKAATIDVDEVIR